MDAPRINKWLKPLSALYGVGVRLRNYLFDKNVLISNSFDIPIVCVGNITIGGATTPRRIPDSAPASTLSHSGG